MTNDVWVLFKKGIPMDVYMSKETAEQNKFESETVGHYIRVSGTATTTREEQLETSNAELRQQVEDLTRRLEKQERRMLVIEQLGGVPRSMRTKRSVA